MLLFWRIRFLNTQTKSFDDRDFWLHTDRLDPVTRALVETCNELDSSSRDMLKYREVFEKHQCSFEEAGKISQTVTQCRTHLLRDYFEDENGRELTPAQRIAALTGDPNWVAIPPGARPHDIAYMFGKKEPVDLQRVCVSPDQLSVLGYFARDYRELKGSSLIKEGPGKLHGHPGQPPEISTAVTDEQIRAFVTVFRRLYMEGDPANFKKASKVFSDAIGPSPLTVWVTESVNEYEHYLASSAGDLPFFGLKDANFPRKLLIDVYLYTQYAHQPDSKRARQFEECLAKVGGSRARLTYLFLTTIWECALRIGNAGQTIVQFFDLYCQIRNVDPGVIQSQSAAHPGIGAAETAEERKARILRKNVEELAVRLWEEAGRPPGGYIGFMEEAARKLGMGPRG